jgi:quercetin dioxygenase-like cupin family protein
MERINTYENWLRDEGLSVIEDYSVYDLMNVPVKPWPRKGGLGVYIKLIGCEGIIDAYVCEIPPGKTLLPQKHLFEETIFILSGYGATTTWIEGGAKQGFEWKEGSLFSPPLNTWHQHFNGQSDKPVRYIGVTKAPVYMNLFHDQDFIFQNKFVFKNRYQGEEGYFSGQGKAHPKRIWESNFVPDCREFKLQEWDERGAGGHNIYFELADNIQSTHVSEFPVGTYKKAHRHGPGAHIVVLSGQGYTLIWPEGGERLKIDWRTNSLFVPPALWFHQHFNTGKEPARYLAVHAEHSFKYKGINRDYNIIERKSVKLGGHEIEYEDEDPEIRRQFKEELRKNDATWRMSKFFPGE